MRVAFITFEFPPFIIGGAGTYAKELTKELAAKGIDVVVISPGDENSETKLTRNLLVRWIKVDRSRPLFMLRFWRHLPRVVKELESKEPFDIVHINDYYSSGPVQKRLSKAPHTLTVHHLVADVIRSNETSLLRQLTRFSGEDNFLNHLIERLAVRYCDSIIAVSEYTKDRLISEYGLNEHKIMVMGESIDMSGYELDHGEVEDFRRAMGLQGRKVVLFVGRVADRRKNLPLLLHAFQCLPGREGYSLLVVGGGDQGEMKDLASKLDISDQVLFTGFVDDEQLKRVFLISDVHAIPSRLEGFGLTILHAMAAGKPIVATRVGAIPELVTDGVNGLTVPPNEPAMMSAALACILENEEIAKRMGETNASQVRNERSWGSVATAMIEYYERIATHH